MYFESRESFELQDEHSCVRKNINVTRRNLKQGRHEPWHSARTLWITNEPRSTGSSSIRLHSSCTLLISIIEGNARYWESKSSDDNCRISVGPVRSTLHAGWSNIYTAFATWSFRQCSTLDHDRFLLAIEVPAAVFACHRLQFQCCRRNRSKVDRLLHDLAVWF